MDAAGQRARSVVIVAARHPQPAIAPGICYGQLDLGLADPVAIGARQIMHNLKALPHVTTLTHVVTSPRVRAHAVATEIAAAMDLPLKIDPNISELNFGAWEGVAWADIPRTELDLWAADPLDYAPGGTETVRQLLHRVDQAWRSAGPSQLWITHGGPLRALSSISGGISITEALTLQFAFCSAHTFKHSV